MKALILSLISVTLLACANGRMLGDPGVIVDTQGVDPVVYESDLAECNRYAEQVSTSAQAASGAAAGAVIGGALGAVLGNSRTAERYAGAGAVSGAVKGATEGAQEKDQIVKRCLSGRGYRVLN